MRWNKGFFIDMIITINDKPEEIKKKLNLAELVLSKHLCAEKLVVEYNQRITPKEEWKNIILHEKDSIEIVSFVGGG